MKIHRSTETMKWCPRCQQYKPFAEFHKDRSHSGGLDDMCKPCKQDYYREYYHDYYLKHREELLPKHRISAQKSLERKRSRNHADA